ncbi:hypothetical protein PPERSA_06905 [Pseudocohnilembus persalinus]|uniref:Uncharacterized protein n=1 Tax=Pseudocohnilembus persalinus TaxID=266149 RepID=A0A0V0QYZ4_PSEPJ|nr:hypothetical protein PPERSA_06905 [Pseudocohnilembus persalinus]|eukprot:KRX07290.1 hypothetical protein PPERSA_06905 [Pseudocohnilembus persalinus]
MTTLGNLITFLKLKEKIIESIKNMEGYNPIIKRILIPQEVQNNFSSLQFKEHYIKRLFIQEIYDDLQNSKTQKDNIKKLKKQQQQKQDNFQNETGKGVNEQLAIQIKNNNNNLSHIYNKYRGSVQTININQNLDNIENNYGKFKEINPFNRVTYSYLENLSEDIRNWQQENINENY